MSSETHKMRVLVKSVGETKEFGANGFKKRELVGELEGTYPQTYQFEFVQDKVGLLDSVIPNTHLTIHYNIRSREYVQDGQETRYFLSLSGWKVEV